MTLNQMLVRASLDKYKNKIENIKDDKKTKPAYIYEGKIADKS